MFEKGAIAEYAAMISFGLMGLVMGVQKLLKGWKETSAETSVVSLMHNELQRMSEQNKILTTELASLQIELLNLNKQLRQLTDENQKLHSEVVSLSNELAKLQKLFNV